MERALIVCDNEKGTAFYKSFLKENGISDLVVVENGPNGPNQYGPDPLYEV